MDNTICITHRRGRIMPFKITQDPQSKEKVIEVTLRGYTLLTTPMFHKGSAFTKEERKEFGLEGLLPPHITTIEEQLIRIYETYESQTTDLQKFIYLASLHDRNEVLFYRLLHDHITEMMPIVYTPVVGTACQDYSRIFRRPRGLYLPYAQMDQMKTMLRNAPYLEHIEVIVVTDGERILGLGDLGVGGIGIPIGKLALYSLCAGINPVTTLPIVLDVGTNNKELLDSPLYLGWKHERIRGEKYDKFVECFVQAVMEVFPNVLLQWEDFAKNNASRLLEKYRDRLCTFNDDIQGTGAVTLAGLMAASDITKTKLRDQRVVLLGAGSSANGICNQLITATQEEGLTESEAISRIWLIDSQDLVHDRRKDLDPFKQKFAQSAEKFSNWRLASPGHVSLMDVVANAHPTVLIGVSAQPRVFNEPLICEIAKHVQRPIIFPLSNPTSKSEGIPEEILRWTHGKALMATGSPFPNIGQCNNAFIFPGVGLGVLASKANRVSDSMFVAAAKALSSFAPSRHDATKPLFPKLENVWKVSRQVAIAVAQEAQRIGFAPKSSHDELVHRIDEKMWYPKYHRLKYKKQGMESFSVRH